MYYNMMETGKRISRLRKDAGMTQEELSDEIGINASYLSRVERGLKSCSVDMFVNLSEVFSVSLDYLILGKEPLEPAHVKERINEMARQLSELAAGL